MPPRSPICAAPICRRTSSTGSPVMLRGTLARTRNGRIICARSALPTCGSRPIRCARLAKRRCGARSRPKACSRARSSFPTTPASSASATTRCAFVHTERLVHKLVPANDGQRNAVAVAKRMIWWFYRRLKDYKLAPSPEQASLLRAQFDRVFKRRTGYATLDRLLKRLLGRKEELLRVLERPEIPLNTNASENDIRAFVTKRKISGGTVSEKGRQARDVMLGLAKTCMKLKIPFFDYLGARLGIPGPDIPNLATLVSPAPS